MNGRCTRGKADRDDEPFCESVDTANFQGDFRVARVIERDTVQRRDETGTGGRGNPRGHALTIDTELHPFASNVPQLVFDGRDGALRDCLRSDRFEFEHASKLGSVVGRRIKVEHAHGPIIVLRESRRTADEQKPTEEKEIDRSHEFRRLTDLPFSRAAPSTWRGQSGTAVAAINDMLGGSEVQPP